MRLVRWECWSLVSLSGPATLIRSELSVAGVGALLSVAACVCSWLAIRQPHYSYRQVHYHYYCFYHYYYCRRVSALLHLLTAVTTLIVIQLVDGGARYVIAGHGYGFIERQYSSMLA